MQQSEARHQVQVAVMVGMCGGRVCLLPIRVRDQRMRTGTHVRASSNV